MSKELVDTLSRGLAILRCFTVTQTALRASDIQTMTEIPKATLFRIFKILRESNYLKYDADSKRYSLGISVLRLGFSVLHSMESREIIRPYLISLTNRFNKSAALLMLDNTDMVFVDRIRVQRSWDFISGVGTRIPVHLTSAGRAVLAQLNHEQLQHILEQLKSEERTAEYIKQNGEEFVASLRVVKEKGYALNDEESVAGVRAIAVPLLGNEGIMYALNIVVRPDEVSIDELESQYAPVLIETAREISLVLGQHGL